MANQSSKKTSGNMLAVLLPFILFVGAVVGLITTFAVGSFMLILAIVCAIGLLIVGLINRGNIGGLILFAIGIIFTIVVIAVLLASLVTVDMGHKVVLTSGPNEARIGEVLDEGWHFDPYYLMCQKESIRYNSQTIEFVGYDAGEDTLGSIDVRSSDNVEIYMDFSITYHIPEQNVSQLRMQYTNYRADIVEQICRSVPRDRAAQWTMNDIIDTHRSEVEQSIRETITHKLESVGLIVDNFALRSIRPPDSVSQAIEEKKVAEQYLITAQYQADAMITLAQGNQTAMIINANGTAQAQVIQANGSAEAIRLITEQFRILNPNSADPTGEYLAWAYIQALNNPDSNIKYVIIPSENGQPVLLNITQ